MSLASLTLPALATDDAEAECGIAGLLRPHACDSDHLLFEGVLLVADAKECSAAAGELGVLPIMGEAGMLRLPDGTLSEEPPDTLRNALGPAGLSSAWCRSESAGDGRTEPRSL